MADLDRWKKRIERAEQNRDAVASWIDDAYEFCLPLRQRSYMTTASDRRTERLFDSTAIDALQEYASRTLDDVWPADSKPFSLEPGSEIEEGERKAMREALAAIADLVMETIENSDFRSAAHEALQDFGISTGFLLPEEGDAVNPLRNRCLPLSQALPDMGPFGGVDFLGVKVTVRAEQVPVRWPDAKLPDEIARKVREQPQAEVKVHETWERDWSDKGTEKWDFLAVVDKKHVIVERSIRGTGSKPFIDMAPVRVAGEVYGRGPALMALPDIMTLNLVKQMVLENGEIAITGLWQAEDDGVMNPQTIQIVPGTIIPKAKGSEGLSPLQAAGDFNVSQLVVQELQGSIKRVFNVEDLGPPTGTPMSATEVMQRTVDRAKRQAGTFGRLLTEFMFPYVRRVVWILNRQGKIRNMPRVDGRAVVIRPLSPITRAQAQDDVLRHDRYVEMVNARFGPQLTGLILDAQAYAEWLAGKMGVEPKLVRGPLQRQQLVQALAQTAAQTGVVPE